MPLGGRLSDSETAAIKNWIDTGAEWDAGLALGPAGKSILVVDSEAGTLTALPTGVPGQPVDESPLPIKSEVAFPNLTWTEADGSDAGARRS